MMGLLQIETTGKRPPPDRINTFFAVACSTLHLCPLRFESGARGLTLRR